MYYELIKNNHKQVVEYHIKWKIFENVMCSMIS